MTKSRHSQAEKTQVTYSPLSQPSAGLVKTGSKALDKFLLDTGTWMNTNCYPLHLLCDKEARYLKILASIKRVLLHRMLGNGPVLMELLSTR